MAEVTLRRLKPEDPDIAPLAAGLNSRDWDGSINDFTAESLTRFLEDDDHIYLVAFVDSSLAGAAHAYLLQHPDGSRYLYIDEVDTKMPYRRRGVATALMRGLLRLAGEYGADEAWLGTEDDNEAAKALYESFSPDEVEHGPIYSFKTKRRGS